MCALFLRHEGYLGALGAFLRHPQAVRPHRYSFTENLATTTRINDKSFSMVGMLEQLPVRLVPFPHLIDPYAPDTLLLTEPEQQHYWIDALETNIDITVKLAAATGNGAILRANEFSQLFHQHLKTLREQPHVYGSLSVRLLWSLREQCLREMGFQDVFKDIKIRDVARALEILPTVLDQIDSNVNSLEKWKRLVEQMWAGNMFDWGSNHVLEMVERGELTFATALDKIFVKDGYDHIQSFVNYVENGGEILHAVVFVDNSGADVILGVLPFVRELIRSCKTKITLAANSLPAINDVTVRFYQAYY